MATEAVKALLWVQAEARVSIIMQWAQCLRRAGCLYFRSITVGVKEIENGVIDQR
jgi:hypothetical protein